MGLELPCWMILGPPSYLSDFWYYWPCYSSGMCVLFEGMLLEWFQFFLIDRVVLGDFHSTLWPLNCGVPQGLLLPLMLFNSYVKLLVPVGRRYGRRCHQYSSDNHLHLNLPSDSNGALDINLDLEVILGWMRENNLKLNPDNTGTLLVV